MAVEGVLIQGQNVTHLMTYILSRIACSNHYETWSDSFCRTENKKAFDTAMEEFSKIDFTKISQAEAEILGFRRWDEDSNLYLVPIWIYDALPNGTILRSFMGSIAVKGTDYIDKDIRFGCLSYGIEVNPTELSVHKSEDTIRLDEMED